jgi:hypothetical protein
MSNLKHLNPDPLHDTDSAASYTGEDPRTMANKRSRGEGADYLKIGRLVRYRQSALDRYLKQCEVTLGSVALLIILLLVGGAAYAGDIVPNTSIQVIQSIDLAMRRKIKVEQYQKSCV